MQAVPSIPGYGSLKEASKCKLSIRTKTIAD